MIIAVRFPPVTHFRKRMSEFFCCGVIACWCVVLSVLPKTFDYPQFSILRLFGSQHAWAVTCEALAFVRGLALWINGAWRATPFLRIAGAAAGLTFWTVISVGMLASGAGATGLAVYPPLAMLELFSIHMATMDARAVWDQSRKGG